MRKSLAVLILCALSAAPVVARAQLDPAREIAALRTEIGHLMERLERLEQSVGEAPAAPAAGGGRSAVGPGSAAAAPPRAEELPAAAPALAFSGDLRYRHESIDEIGETDRNRHRVRGRFDVTAKVNDRVELGLVLATGEDDPVSANTTLGEGFNRKSIGVDRAFFAWQATDALRVSGGKMPNPFLRPGDHHLVYDGDLNPEGLALRYSSGAWFANYAALWVQERGAADDSMLLGGQVGYRRSFGSETALTVGASYYDYLKTQGQTPFWDGEPNGNRVDAFGNYSNDYNIAELFAELELAAAGRPLTLFADYVTNTEAESLDRGYALGMRLGEITRPGTWRMGYVYQDLEADAVVGTYTDSDFAGGGTDGKGHVVEFRYGLRERLLLGLRYFINERGAAAGNPHDYNRLQADVSFEY